MISITAGARVLLAIRPVDFRKADQDGKQAEKFSEEGGQCRHGDLEEGGRES
jgi:hypothetical protein